MSLARVRALVVLGVLVLTAAVVVGWAITRDGSRTRAAGACVGETEVPVPTAAQVQVRVYNATETAGLAEQVAADLRGRSFQIVSFANDPEGRVVDAPAEIRYGAAGAGAAHLLRAYIPDAEVIRVDRDDQVVDVAIGSGYSSLAGDLDVTTALSQLPKPTAPCASASPTATVTGTGPAAPPTGSPAG